MPGIVFHVNRLLGGGGFPSGTVVKNQPSNAGDMGSSPGPGATKPVRHNY